MSFSRSLSLAAKAFTPLSDRVLVVRASVATKTAGGLFLPDADSKKSSEGKVISVGPGFLNPDTGKNIQMNVKVGDRVLLPEYGGMKVDLGGEVGSEDHFLFREGEILGKFD